jgi:nanoRNase/pAp phosphatase (c-di-AMP/oligoRNAs hydrolase)
VGVEAPIVYKGIIGRAENKALVRYLQYPLKRLNKKPFRSDPLFAIVDTQPGAGNNALPAQAEVAIVIDHHPYRQASSMARFKDVRPNVGSTASIMVEYLRLVEIEPSPPLATALFYGIKTDTLGLGRGTTSLDTSAICYLLPLIDLEALLKIERAEVPLTYFETFAATLQTVRIYQDVVIAQIGAMDYPDLAAEMADFLLRMKGARWIICMGIFRKHLFISVRTQNQRGAGQMIQEVIGNRGIAGGHGAMAGGQVPLDEGDPQQLLNDVTQQLLRHLNIPAEETGRPLI